MIKILENSKTLTLEHHNNDDVNESFSQKGKYNQTSISHVAALRSLAFLTFLRFPLCWLSTLLFNKRTFAIKVVCNQQSLYRTSGNGNMCPSVRIPLLSSLLWSQLLLQKSWPSASSVAATTTPLVASVYAKSTSQTIYAMYSRCNAFTMSYVMYATFMLFLLPTVHCDNGDDFFLVNAFSISPETTTPEFDYAGRGQKKFGDKCENTLECGFPGSICDAKKKSCQCTEDLPVTNHFDKCGKEAAVNESCFFNEQCEVKHYQTECRDGRCTCRYEMQPFWGKDGTVECKGRGDKRGPETYIDPAMIGVLVGMALMFVIICVVLRLFSQARWRENRTIFNTPNPRLMNVSLLRDSKLLHGQERRGSRMSVRAPSRQPSMASLRPHSPNPSLGSHSDSANASNASATSIRSTRSNSVAPGNIAHTAISQLDRKGSQHHTQQQHHQHQHQQQPQQQMPLITNITANPAAESVAVEIIVPEIKK
ncbi:uncharacterized protein jus isoform X2 [Eurosta solidaginis]|uniref:uncharacterized protein jus isoform X2 n=1 Tax=Eurosta solidaginis TaxID=178769 RepID=UPI003530FB02